MPERNEEFVPSVIVEIDEQGNVLNPEEAVCSDPDCPMSDPENVAKIAKSVAGLIEEGREAMDRFASNDGRRSTVGYSRAYADKFDGIFRQGNDTEH
ncbi:hypothetical protein KKA95_02425 [Patescibacteria group bacterium]|nr:hypothetical protein [Patescibacteria group bacterium]